MSGNGRILTPQQMAQMQAQQGPQLAIAQPINDVQLISLMAAQVPGTAQERVTLAQDIFVGVVTTHQRVHELIEEAKRKAAPKEPS